VALHHYRYGDYASLERFIKTRTEKRRSLPHFMGYWETKSQSSWALHEPALRLSLPPAPFDRKRLIPAPLPPQRPIADENQAVTEPPPAPPKADTSLTVTTETPPPAPTMQASQPQSLNQSDFLSSEDLMLFLRKRVPQAGDAELTIPFTLPGAAIAPPPPALPSKATFIQR
jgi:hypothetical protein